MRDVTSCMPRQRSWSMDVGLPPCWRCLLLFSFSSSFFRRDDVPNVVYLACRCVGHKAACELVLTGRIFRAKDAPPGLFNHTVPTDQVLGKALDIAREICLTSPMSSMLNRQMIIREVSVADPSPRQSLFGLCRQSLFGLCRQRARHGLSLVSPASMQPLTLHPSPPPHPLRPRPRPSRKRPRHQPRTGPPDRVTVNLRHVARA